MSAAFVLRLAGNVAALLPPPGAAGVCGSGGFGGFGLLLLLLRALMVSTGSGAMVAGADGAGRSPLIEALEYRECDAIGDTGDVWLVGMRKVFELLGP